MHSRATQEQLEHFTPPHAFDSENRATMIVNGYTFSYRNLDIRAAVDDRAYVVTMTATLF